MKKITAGEMNLRDASAMADLLEHRRQIIRTEDHEMRLRAVRKSLLEKAAAG